MGLSANAVKVLEARYLARDDQGRVAESPAGMFRRVAAAIAAAEERWPGASSRRAEVEERFLRLMESLAFIPNSPTLMNAGLPLGQLSACFVLPIEDSLPSIFESLKRMAMIHQSGGGAGFSFSRLRPNGDVVRSTSGVASGPV
ncbi:MAG: ribonucleoside-diphosphate reductase, adenosylcobalamin-dependent, partial [Chloroflexi bacterium]|nr:ribonucleoside-diphosphate reductase, adenosylcobalamin-dependent [Chloroflexota bacterium]